MAKKKWAVLVYFAADVKSATMRRDALANWDQLASVGSSTDVYVAAQLNRKDEPTLQTVFPDKSATAGAAAGPQKMAAIDSGKAANVAKFLDWGTEQCPANNIMFVIWGHGYGLDDYWPPASDDSRTSSSQPEEFRGASGGAFALSVPVQAVFFEGETSMVGNWVTGSYLLNTQLAALLQTWSAKQGRKLPVLGLDCCEMAMVEVWDQMADSVDVAISSQSGIPYKSWPYFTILKSLLAEPQMTPQTVSSMVVKAFVESYNNDRQDVVTLSACDLTQTSSLNSALKNLAAALTQACQQENTRSQIFASRNASPIYDTDGFIDLDTFCNLLQQNIQRPVLSQACDEVRKARKQYVIQSGYSLPGANKMISLSKGVSIWFPGWIQYPHIAMLERARSIKYLSSGYDQLTFSTATGWDQFLTAILQYTRGVSPKENMMTLQGSKDKVRPKGKDGIKDKVRPKGKPDGTKEAIFLGGSSREAGVIVRASVEAFGPIGDTNLTVTVNWPAGSVGTAAPRDDADEEGSQSGDDTQEAGTKVNIQEPLPLPSRSAGE